MKFAHLADSHLGYRQFGLIEREKDFYQVFEDTINKIIEEDVDFVIHSGDLFEFSKPSPNALLVFQKALLKLKGAGIPMYAIMGNHETLMRKDAIPPQVLFKKFGLKLISMINTHYVYEDVFIGGLPYIPKSQNKLLKNKLEDLSSKANKYSKRILVLHQGIDKYLPFEYELEIGDIPENFNYYALGHIHKYIKEDYGEGVLVYPGSADVWRSNEIKSYEKDGKGFCVVDLDKDKPSIKRVKVEIPRKFIKRTISSDNITHELLELKNSIKNLDKKPILSLDIKNTEGNINDIYEKINKSLKNLCLMIRPTILSDLTEEELIINQKSSIGPHELILEYLKEFDDKNINNLAIDLYDSLSKDNDERTELILSNFLEENFEMSNFNKNKDIQTKF